FFFGGLDPRELTEDAFAILRAEAPFVEVDESSIISEGEATTFDVLKLLTASGLAASNGAAKRLLEQGGVSVNKQKVTAAERHVAASDALLRGRHVVVGKGKRDFALLQVR
ncbi:MAG: tyrS, partial [Candidatus Eremiobacteraeota bacterium]|nr:tyrS [Candidatus Eremiobacteraeota bacterium]